MTYWCSICRKPFTDEEDEPHTAPDGVEDCHSGCCPICSTELQPELLYL